MSESPGFSQGAYSGAGGWGGSGSYSGSQGPSSPTPPHYVAIINGVPTDVVGSPPETETGSVGDAAKFALGLATNPFGTIAKGIGGLFNYDGPTGTVSPSYNSGPSAMDGAPASGGGTPNAGGSPMADSELTPAEEQARQNLILLDKQTQANRPNINTPQGSSAWTKDAEGNWTQDVTLSPEQQQIYDAQAATQVGRNQLAQSMLPQAQAALGKAIDYKALPLAGGSLQARQLATGLDFSGAPELSTGDEVRNRAEQSIYGRATSRLDPRFDEQGSELRTRLYNQGLREGDAAFDAEIGKFETSKNDAYQTALDAAIQGGGQEAARTFGMDLSGRQQSVSETTNQANFLNDAAAQGFSMDQAISAYQNQLRQQALNEQQGARSQAINEMNSLQSGQQVTMPEFPSFATAGQGQTPDLVGAENTQFQRDLAASNASKARTDSWIQAGSQLVPMMFDYGGSSNQDPYGYGGSSPIAPSLL